MTVGGWNRMQIEVIGEVETRDSTSSSPEIPLLIVIRVNAARKRVLSGAWLYSVEVPFMTAATALREFPGKLHFINPPYRKLRGKKVGEKRRDTARELWILFFCLFTYATLFTKIIFVAESQQRNLMVANCDTALRWTQFICYLYARWFRYAKFCQYDLSSSVVPGRKNILHISCDLAILLEHRTYPKFSDFLFTFLLFLFFLY